MHIPDGFLSPGIALAADAAALAAIGGAALAVRRDARASGGHGALPQRRPPLGASAAPLVGAFVFAAQMLNVHVAGGTSGHLVGAVLACALLGPSLGFLTIAAVLATQAVALGDGGLLALGANVLTMGGIGALAARLAGSGVRFAPGPVQLAAASGLAVLAGAAAVGALLELSGTASGAIAAMAEAHLPIALLEVGLTGAASAACAAAARLPRGVRLAGCVATIAVLVALTPLASSQPDGLERVALDLGFAHLGS